MLFRSVQLTVQRMETIETLAQGLRVSPALPRHGQLKTLPRIAHAGGALGTSALRPDGIPKVQGRFAFSSDAWADNMLWGATLRSPHPYARIKSIDTSAALAIKGVSAVVTANDVPGKLTYGLIASDQPVFAGDYVRYAGEPVAAGEQAVFEGHPHAQAAGFLTGFRTGRPCGDEKSAGRDHPATRPEQADPSASLGFQNGGEIGRAHG